jgi:tRNA1Val (adenine37-N6)-methyltransferase
MKLGGGSSHAQLVQAHGCSMKNQRTIAPDETLDSLFGGGVELYQSRAGYRFSLDAVLLAHFVKVKEHATVVDLGAGNGAVTLMLAFLHRTARVVGVEIQPAMLARARRSVALNALEDRVSMRSGDVRAPAALGETASFDIAVCNPPYRAPLSGRVSPNAEKRVARHEVQGDLGHFLEAGRFLLRRKGRLALIYPAFRCVDVLASMRAADIEPKRLKMVHSSCGVEASLLLVEGVKEGKSEVTVEPPLFVYDEEQCYRPEIAAMLRGKDNQSKS